MIRRLFTVASVVSLVMCVGAAALCVWSYHAFTQFDGWVASYPPASRRTRGPFRVQEGEWRLNTLRAYIDWGRVDAEIELSKGRYSDGDMRNDYPQGAHHAITVAVHDAPANTAGDEPLFSFTHEGDAALEPHEGTTDEYRIRFPIWSLVVLTGLAPLLAAFRLARRLRAKGQGVCVACGYDLRASTGRCSECGTPIAAAAETGTMLKPEAGDGDARVTGR